MKSAQKARDEPGLFIAYRAALFADAECKEFFFFNKLVTYRGRVGVKLTKSAY
ncbi:hypothetical protein ACSZMJ_12165 [Aeromonas caviae]|uniref:hypothetical protein n=1 Tax=Aeromonas caviae TaxID=648 RepID=UPI003EC6B33B